MAVYPHAIKKFITAPKGRQRMAVYNRINLHIAVSEAPSLFGYFNRTGNVDSHFYVRRDGTVEQYVDTSMQAFADLRGNDATISIETQGGMGADLHAPWTDAQVHALALLSSWIMNTHGIPKKLATDSVPFRDSSKGLSWHRLGVDSYPTLYRAGWRQPTGLLYSASRGKVCPGDARIEQIPGILALINKAGGTPTPTPAPAPAPAPGPVRANVTTDGWWGRDTTTQTQLYAGLVADGEVWNQWAPNRGLVPGFSSGWQWNYSKKGSPTWRWVQREVLHVPVWRQDGLVGISDVNDFIRIMGFVPDGKLDGPSNSIREYQRRLNAGTL